MSKRIGDRREKVRKLLAIGVQPAIIAETLDMKPDTVYNDIRQIKKEGGLVEEWRRLAEDRKESKERLKDKEINKKIEELEILGYNVSISPGYMTGGMDASIAFEGDRVRIGIVSDLQGGSKYMQVSILQAAYDYFESLGIKTVLNLGDITDGTQMYRGHVFELFRHGVDAQVDVVNQVVPQKSSIQTITVGGNHDHSFFKAAGVDSMAMLTQRRHDMEFAGYFSAMVYVNRKDSTYHPEPGRNRIPILLMHPKGGMSYARSYKLQKFVEQLSPQNKPRVMLVGHYHSCVHVPGYRNVEAISVPCMQSQTPYLRQLGLYPQVGFCVMELIVNDRDAVNGLAKINVDWHFQYENYDFWGEAGDRPEDYVRREAAADDPSGPGGVKEQT